jgi:hypothetical protein
MALPPPKRVELGHFTRFWGRNNYPQWSGTRPWKWEIDTVPVADEKMLATL